MIEKLRDRTRQGPPDALDHLLEKIHDVEDYEGLKTISQVVLDALMQREREVFLRQAGTDNKANGYITRGGWPPAWEPSSWPFHGPSRGLFQRRASPQLPPPRGGKNDVSLGIIKSHKIEENNKTSLNYC